VLGLLLALGQHLSTRHWLSHAMEAAQAKATGTPVQAHCHECDGMAAFGAALPTVSAALPLATDREKNQLFAVSPAAPAVAATLGYLSRAPPLLG
jgi:imidazolonepropionase-like amidohydrolase